MHLFRRPLGSTALASAALLAAVGWLTLPAGCAKAARPSHSDTAEPAGHVEPAATYHASRGLKLTPVSSEFIGLAVAEFAGNVPGSAVLRTVEGTFVYVENGGWLLRTPVKLGTPASEPSAFALADGLYEGDRIVTSGVRALWMAELHFLRAGQACAHEG